MPRYFFQVSSDTVKISDTKGHEFSCAKRAYLYARSPLQWSGKLW